MESITFEEINKDSKCVFPPLHLRLTKKELIDTEQAKPLLTSLP